jgi:hypothetical protein
MTYTIDECVRRVDGDRIRPSPELCRGCQIVQCNVVFIIYIYIYIETNEMCNGILV